MTAALLRRIGARDPIAVRPLGIDRAVGFERDPAGGDRLANGVLGDAAMARISPAGETHAALALPICSKIQ